ncbi:carboxypeptidase regulatory-like domain-containing protein [Pedobacter hiemivivus]|uniref:Carboxypeptidase regulatory-like domain-containing protein n=1 Tax=Pedobacter hiemivivus TaxID=2530454 RepID=A0A4U1GNW0_9SPHI|nr:carboxypeptidase-like regulatory domain-containing protein [Pedobacter hiemivivus]TKC65189.1 carboxypeptidase regulatory-like domain-containing protein [Pedobacter hiemivivus]
MKKLFALFFSTICFCATAQTPGQPIKGIIVKGGKNPGGNTQLSVSGGINNPGSSIKTKTNLVNGYALGANVYVPLFAKEGNGNLAGHTAHFFTIGLNAGGEYFAGIGDYNLAELPSYNISGQSAGPNIRGNNDGNKQNGFKAEAGVQANFSFGKVTLSPVLNAAYMSLKQNAISVVQDGTVNGVSYSKEIYAQQAAKTTGIAFIPKLRIAFFPGKLGFYLEGAYTSGPDVKTQAELFKPQGKVNDAGFYSQDQMSMGSSKPKDQNAKYNSFGVNFGLSIPLGNAISRRRLKGKVTKPGGNGVNLVNPLFQQDGNASENPMQNPSALAKPGNPIGGIIVKGGKNPGPRDMIAVTNENGEIVFSVTETGEYTLQLTIPEASGKSISSKGVKRIPSENNKREVRTYSGGRKNEVSDENMMARPGQPIKGVIVKGGKNPGGNSINLITNENGEFTFAVQEAGEYKLQITTPEAPGKSISE